MKSWKLSQMPRMEAGQQRKIRVQDDAILCDIALEQSALSRSLHSNKPKKTVYAEIRIVFVLVDRKRSVRSNPEDH